MIPKSTLSSRVPKRLTVKNLICFTSFSPSTSFSQSFLRFLMTMIESISEQLSVSALHHSFVWENLSRTHGIFNLSPGYISPTNTSSSQMIAPSLSLYGPPILTHLPTASISPCLPLLPYFCVPLPHHILSSTSQCTCLQPSVWLLFETIFHWQDSWVPTMLQNLYSWLLGPLDSKRHCSHCKGKGTHKEWHQVARLLWKMWQDIDWVNNVLGNDAKKQRRIRRSGLIANKTRKSGYFWI